MKQKTGIGRIRRIRKMISSVLYVLISIFAITGCGSQGKNSVPDISIESVSVQNQQADLDGLQSKSEQMAKGTSEMTEMKLIIDGTEVSVDWENNESVDELRELVSAGGLEIPMSMYGGFEQVGSIGQTIPRNDKQTTTKAGDIVLYSGNQIVVFYGSNSWTYTRLGRITEKTDEELAELLGNGDVIIMFEMK